MKNATRCTACRLCRSPRLALAVHLAPTPVADAYRPPARAEELLPTFPLDLALCEGCGHVQLFDSVDPRILFANGYLFRTGSSAGLVEHFRAYAAQISARANATAGSLVVDIGSNDGTLLKFFKNAGHNVLGVDPAQEIAREANAAGVETIPDFFTPALATEIRRTRGAAAIVTANNVFAHADGLGDIADGIRILLADDGIFVFEVSYLVDIIDKMLFDTVYHEHLCYHSIEPLVRFFDAHGLELYDVERINSKGGSIRGFVQRKGGPRGRRPIVGELLEAETILGLRSPATYALFESRIRQAGAQVRAAISDAKKAGLRVAGYGASATVTTLIHEFGIAPMLDFLVDDNVARHGLVAPGSSLTVRPPSAIQTEDVDVVVVLAWNYATPIIEKNRKAIEAGTRFLVPLPSPRVV